MYKLNKNKILLLLSNLIVLAALLGGCSSQAVYDMLQERERQLCLQQGREDCHRAEPYDKYEQERDEVIK